MKIVSLDNRRSPHPDRAKRLKEAHLRIRAHQIDQMRSMMRRCHRSPIARAQFVLEDRRASRS